MTNDVVETATTSGPVSISFGPPRVDQRGASRPFCEKFSRAMPNGPLDPARRFCSRTCRRDCKMGGAT